MALPAGYTTRNVHIKLLDSAGNPRSGTITFASDPYRLSDDTVGVPPFEVVAKLVSGEATVTLICTDDPDLTPATWAYTITERLGGGYEHTWLAQLPVSSPSTVEYAALIETVELPSAYGEAVTTQNVEDIVEEKITDSPSLATLLVPIVAADLTDRYGDAGGLPGPLDGSSKLPLAQVPDLPASRITSGTFDTARIPTLSQYELTANKNATNGYAGLTAGKLDATQLPNHSAALLTSGTLPTARITTNVANGVPLLDSGTKLLASQLPNHSASLLTSGTVPIGQLPSEIQNTRIVCMANRSTTQTVTAGVAADLQFPNETLDLYNMFAPGTDNTKFTLVAIGVWEITLDVIFGTAGTGKREASCYRNGSGTYEFRQNMNSTGSGEDNMTMTGTTVATAVTDYVKLQVFRSTGTDITRARVTLKWLGPTS